MVKVVKVQTRKAQVFDFEAFGKALKIKRTVNHNYTTRDIADILELPHSTISRMERGLPAEMLGILVVCDWMEQSPCDFIIYQRVKAFPIIFQDGTIVLKKNSKAAKFLNNHTHNKK